MARNQTPVWKNTEHTCEKQHIRSDRKPHVESMIVRVCTAFPTCGPYDDHGM